jgi:peptidoglycan/LPS O-acetylase OafA/YrhL
MVAISIFLMFGIALAVVYVEHYYDVSISKLITWVCMAITIVAVAAVLLYPYHTVSFDERVAHVYLCIGVVMCCLITMVAAAYIDASK